MELTPRLGIAGRSGSSIGRWPPAPANSEEEHVQGAARALGGGPMRFPSRPRGRTSVRGRLEEMGLDDRSSGKCLAGENAEDFNVDLARQGLRQVQDAAEQTSILLVIVAGLAGRLELKVPAAGSRHHSWPTGHLMMMVVQRPRTDVDHQVSGQGGNGNQAVAQKKHHVARRQQPTPSPGTAVLPRHTQCRQALFRRQEGGQETPWG